MSYKWSARLPPIGYKQTVTETCIEVKERPRCNVITGRSQLDPLGDATNFSCKHLSEGDAPETIVVADI